MVNSNKHCERNCERRWVGRRNRQHYLILMLPITLPLATPLAESDILVKNILKKRFGVMRKNEELNSAVKTNVGLQFLRLMANSFIPDNPIRILFNRSTVKVSLLLAKWTPRWAATTQYSWSTIPNTSILRAVTARRTRQVPSHPCWVTYVASVTSPVGAEHYTGLTGYSVKKRYYKNSGNFRNSNSKHSTRLSSHIWKLKEDGKEFQVNWEIMHAQGPHSQSSEQQVYIVSEINLKNP